MDRRYFVRSTLAASVAALNVEAVDTDTTAPKGGQGGSTQQTGKEVRPKRTMARAARPVAEPAFTPLRPGAVKPMGWLRDWAIAARNGITGYLDERHSDFGATWKGAIPGAEQLDKGWPLEMGAYWLDGALRLGYILQDDFLINKAKHRLDLVVNGVNAGATSFVYWRSDRPDGYDPWPHAHLGRALVAYYEGTGDSRILDALVKVYRSYPPRVRHSTASFGPPQESMVLDRISIWDRAIPNLDPMLEAYSWSGERQILETALAAVRAPQTASVIDEWAKGDILPGHAVNYHENSWLPALLYPWTGERRFLTASLNRFAWLEEHHMLPYGVASGEEFLSGIGAFRFTETCNVTSYIWSQIRLLRIQGDRLFADRIERAFFNAGPAPVARDFQTMAYYQSPNRIDALFPSGPADGGNRSLPFGPFGQAAVRCCVGTITRLIPNYVMYMWMATHDRGLAASLYGPCAVSALAGENVPVRLVCETAYPFDETIQVKVDPERAASFPLYFRIPGWCANPHISVNRSPLNQVPDKNGYVRIVRRWNKGDAVQLQFPMVVQIKRGYETEYPKIEFHYENVDYYQWKSAATFEKRRLPYASVYYGPLLFALPIRDIDPNTPFNSGLNLDAIAQDAVGWQYALDNEGSTPGSDVEVERKEMPAKWRWQLTGRDEEYGYADAVPLALKIPARSFAWNPTDAQALPDTPVDGGQAARIRLVPYGCTKFRISMFPVTHRAWVGA